MFQKLTILILLTACSSTQQVTAPVSSIKEFSAGELILGTQLLTKIFDKEMAPLECVPDPDEAALLLRTIRPRMDVVEDDLQAMLDNSSDVTKLIDTCEQNCTCGFVDELLREHLVPLTSKQKQKFNTKKNVQELSRCLNFVQTTFCKSDLYMTLEREKKDFSYEEVQE